MVTVIQDPNKRLYDSIGSLSEALGGLGGSYMKRKDLQNTGSILQKALSGLGENPTPEQVQSLLSSVIAQGGDPTLTQNVFKQLNDARKNELLMMKLQNQQSGGTTKQTDAEKVVSKKMGELYNDLVINQENINFKENLDFLEQNLPNVGRQKSISTGSFAIPNEMFSEYSNRGNLVLDGVIKIFNKAGVLPQKKLEWLRNDFAISPYDTQEQIQGKINALRSLQKVSDDFLEDYYGLVEQYGPNIPFQEFIKLKRKSENEVDALDKEARKLSTGKTENKKTGVSSLPKKGDRVGQMLADDNGNIYRWTGSTWRKEKI